MRSSSENTDGRAGGAAKIQPDQIDGKSGEKSKEVNADPSDHSDSSDAVRGDRRSAKSGGGEKRRKNGKRNLESSPRNDDDRERDRRKRRRKRDKKMDSSSDSSSDDDSSSEEEEKRRRKHHKRRKAARKKRRDSDSSASESDGDTDESDRKRRRRDRKHGDQKRGQRHGDSGSESTDSGGRVVRKKKREKRKSFGDESKALLEADKKRAKKEKRKKKEKLGSGAVTDRYGKYGVIREVDMWSKRPEFGAWLSEVKHVNIETLPNREERELFKDFMEDYNTATMPSKKYYNLELHHRNKVAKMHARGQQVVRAEKVVFDDEAEKRVELQRQRDLKKEEDYQAYKASMAAGMAQDMREQDHLRNEMQYQYRLGNMEAVDAIKRRLAPEDPNTVVP